MNPTQVDQVFQYPFQGQELLAKQNRWRRLLLEQSDSFEPKRIAILGGSTTFNIRNLLELFLLRKGFKPTFYESGYNRYFEEAVFEMEGLKAFQPDVVYIHTTSHNLLYPPLPDDSAECVEEKLNQELGRYRRIWQSLQDHFPCAIIQNNFELPLNRVLGNLDSSAVQGMSRFILRLNLAMGDAVRSMPRLYINDIHYLASLTGLERWHDSRLWYSFKYALSFDAMPILANNLASIVSALYGKTQKALVVDLDNTMWGGVIGDDGPSGIEIGKENPRAEAFSDLQLYVKNLHRRGIVLAVSSKNEEMIAREGFERPESVLKLTDFQSFKANWEPKPDNLVKIAQELNLGLDSLVFLDDNPAEREIVRARLPMVKVPPLGDSVEEFIGHLDKGGWFEPVFLSADDLERNRYYHENRSREELKNSTSTIGDFLASLQMTAEICAFSPPSLQRITQLINKTNQFNLTTRRCNLAEVESMMNGKEYITLCGKLCDKFGDNGLITVLAGKITGDTVEIILWLMSCRVLQRGVEDAMMDRLVEEARARGIRNIVGVYLPTAKNGMVKEHYLKMGFTRMEETGDEMAKWIFRIPESYSPRNRFIKISAVSSQKKD